VTAATSPIDTASPISALIVRAGGCRWAIPAGDAIEVMRALPIRAVASPFPAMIGLSVVRGRPIPVVDIARLLTDRSDADAARFVTVRTGDRVVALLVSQVEGVRTIAARPDDSRRSLAQAAGAGVIASLDTLDREFLGLLSTAMLLPEAAP
jgi:purine-binding chemotaxis protein CheW